jgi:hypothetical protein
MTRTGAASLLAGGLCCVARTRAQRDNANRRGIPFRFSLLEWLRWWLMELAKLEVVRSMR